MSFHKTYSHLVVIWNWRNTYFKLSCVFPLIFHIYCVYTHTYNVCLQGFIHMFTGLLARQCRKLWLAPLLLSAKGSSSMLRWSCKLSWKWVSFAVSFPLLWIYISQKVLASALCKWGHETLITIHVSDTLWTELCLGLGGGQLFSSELQTDWSQAMHCWAEELLNEVD